MPGFEIYLRKPLIIAYALPLLLLPTRAELPESTEPMIPLYVFSSPCSRVCVQRTGLLWKRFFESSFGTSLLNVCCILLHGLKSQDHGKMMELIFGDYQEYAVALFGKLVVKFPMIPVVQWILLMRNLYCGVPR